MKFLTDDDRLGIVITPTEYPKMYRFQLVLNGRLIGDTDPSIIGSAMLTLGKLKELNDSRLSPDPSGHAALMEAHGRSKIVLRDWVTVRGGCCDVIMGGVPCGGM